MNATAARHIAAIQSGVITKTTVIGMRKAINADARRSAGWSVPKSAIPNWDVYQMLIELDRSSPKICGDLHDSGVKLLQSKRYAKRLAKYWDITSDIAYFELVRFDMIGERSLYAVPVYRCVGGNGGSFRFRNIPWQSGGDGPELVA